MSVISSILLFILFLILAYITYNLEQDHIELKERVKKLEEKE